VYDSHTGFLSLLQALEGWVGSGAAASLTQREVDVAMAADDVAAELQLGGRWN
jgi:hypothetical protein